MPRSRAMGPYRGVCHRIFCSDSNLSVTFDFVRRHIRGLEESQNRCTRVILESQNMYPRAHWVQITYMHCKIRLTTLEAVWFVFEGARAESICRCVMSEAKRVMVRIKLIGECSSPLIKSTATYKAYIRRLVPPWGPSRECRGLFTVRSIQATRPPHALASGQPQKRQRPVH
jgi:hypothetical protein